MAAAAGLAADNLVVVGSPGTSLDRAAAAQLRNGARVWAGLADRDPIAIGIGREELPMFDPHRGGAAELWHGANPVTDEFGALRFGTAGSSGHSAYFAAQSLANLALIVRGRYDDVNLVD